MRTRLSVFLSRSAVPILAAIIAPFSYADSSEGKLLSLHDKAMVAVEKSEAELISFRHDIHRFPELAGNEKRTSAKIADKLVGLGFNVRTGVGGYGVVATVKGNDSGPLIAFRADMDAVQGDASDPVSYRSQVVGAHHICGHDMHSTIGIGIAEGLAAIKADLPGNVMLIFQPAEEAGAGAEDMLTDDVFGDELPVAIFALHTAPFDVGTLTVLPDGMMAGRTRIDVTLSGMGDLDLAAEEVKTVITANGNITPDTMLLFQTRPFVFIDLLPVARTDNTEIVVSAFVMSAGLTERQKVKKRLRHSVELVDIADVTLSIDFSQALEGINNDPELLELASSGIEGLAPGVRVIPSPGVIPAFSEDFGSFQKAVPGVMYLLGVDNPNLGTVGFPHSPDYVADDAAILVGTEAMLAAILQVMTAER
ncbi:MAG: M20/M25/M40 family metallo-hydrolase [Congregibacter sp.]|nr:M20/M25/M40 family metallo-hydrolase [Congregibacter sp.]